MLNKPEFYGYELIVLKNEIQLFKVNDISALYQLFLK